MMVALTVQHKLMAGPIASPIGPITMHTSKELNLFTSIGGVYPQPTKLTASEKWVLSSGNCLNTNPRLGQLLASY